jgi:hypothetical protein
MKPAAALVKLRKACLALPAVSERPSHGTPAWFVGGKPGKQFATFWNDHHGDGRLAIWCAAPAGMQAMLVESSPEHFFVPPYVGHLGWVGVHLDKGLAWKQVVAILEAAHASRVGVKKRRPASH